MVSECYVISLLRRDLDSLERHAVCCEDELKLNCRPRCKAAQPVHESSSSGDDGERQEQGEGVGEGGSFTSEGSGREGESTAESSEQTLHLCTYALSHLVEDYLLFCTCSECRQPQLAQRGQRYRPVTVWRRHTHSELFVGRPRVTTLIQCLYMILWPWKVFKRNCSYCIHNRHVTADHLLGIDVLATTISLKYLPWPLRTVMRLCCFPDATFLCMFDNYHRLSATQIDSRISVHVYNTIICIYIYIYIIFFVHGIIVKRWNI